MYLIVVVIMSIIIHIRWFVPGVFSYGDWWYMAPELLSEFKNISNVGIWKSVFNFGSVDPQIYFFPLNFIRGILSFLPHTDYWGLFFVYLLPIIIVPPIATFFLIKKFIPDNLAATVGSVAYTFTTCFLTMQTAALTIGLAYAITPLTLLILTIFVQDKYKRISILIITSLIMTLTIIVEPRLFYILLIIILPVVLSTHRLFVRYILLGIFIVLLNFYWILPILMSGTEEIYAITNRPLFGNEFRSIKHALTGVQPAWSWNGPEPFVTQPIYMIFWLIPVFVFVGMFFVMKQTRTLQRMTIFMYVIALLGIFLAKQSHAPLPEIYEWLYEHFPGFSLYRESSKFYVLIAIAYAYLISFTFYAGSKYYKERKFLLYRNVRIVSALILIGIFFVGALPLLVGTFGSMFVHREIAEDYDLYKDFILKQDEYFRTEGVPIFPRWATYTADHPKVDTINVLNNEWIYYKKNQIKAQDNIEKLFQSVYMNQLLDVSAIKYVFVPVRDIKNEDDFFTFIDNTNGGIARKEYITLLDQIKSLKKVDIGTQELVVYQNENYKAYIRALDKMYNLQSMQNLDQKYNFITSDLGDKFNFVSDKDIKSMPVVDVHNVFESMKSENIVKDSMRDMLVGSDKNTLYMQEDKNVRKIKVNNQLIIKSNNFKNENKFIAVPLDYSYDNLYHFTYNDAQFDFSNQIINASFEEGLWTDFVGDCNNYDNNGLISMNLINIASDKNQALELHAQRHIACTSRDNIDVDSEYTYLLTFDYQSDNAKNVGYSINFDNNWDKSIQEKIAINDNNWHTFTKKINIPDNAATASLYIYSYSKNNKEDVITRYDNFYLVKLPKMQRQTYVLSESKVILQKPKELYFEIINPAKKIIHVKGAKNAFYIVMSEKYHDKWILAANNKAVQGFLKSWWPFVHPNIVESDNHFQYMTFLNGWYIDVDKYCQRDDVCVRNDDGTYDIEFVAEFFPQRWFYLGLCISSSVFFVLICWLILSFFIRKIKVKKFK